MPNLFDTIVGKLPEPKAEDVNKLKELEAAQAPAKVQSDFSKLNMKDMVAAWQKNPTPDNTGVILKKMQPTISSAINSYAPGMESDLAVKAANLTLSALKQYNPAAGTEPGTFVFHNLKRLNRYAADRSAILRYPEQQMADIASINKFQAQFEDDKGREPSIAEIADHMGMSEKKIDRLLSTSVVTSESALSNPDNGDLMTGARDLANSDYLEYVYASSGPIDQKIMEWTSGLHGGKILSNNDIASRLKISAAAVSQRKAKLQQALSDVRGAL